MNEGWRGAQGRLAILVAGNHHGTAQRTWRVARIRKSPHDMTRKKRRRMKFGGSMRMESRSWSARRNWRRRNQELEAFSYSVSHDLRAPLDTFWATWNYGRNRWRSWTKPAGIIANDCGIGGQDGPFDDGLLEFSRMGRAGIWRHERVSLAALLEDARRECAEKSRAVTLPGRSVNCRKCRAIR